MKKSLFYYLLLIGLLTMGTALASCSNDGDGPNVKDEEPAQYSIKLSAPQKKVLEQSNDFAFNVLKAINSENANVFVSPYILGQALAMLANGAEGDTFDEIASVLKIGDGTNIDDINSFYATMNTALTADIKCSSKVAVANSLWINKQFENGVKSSYQNDMLTHYGAMVEALDFLDEKTIGTINDWSREQTGGLIPTIINELDANKERAILLNSLYFKGLWNYFPKKNTYYDNFRNQFDRNEKVKMMKSDKCELNGFITDDELMAEFDYGGKAFQMQVIIPRKQKINDYIASMDGDKFAQLASYLMKSESQVAMPKFKCAYSYNLVEPLKKMGIEKVFVSGQLGKITSKPLFLTEARQNTTIEVNEEGSIATATTRLNTSGDTSPGFLPKEFIIDHPFIYLIRERQTGAILFIGKVQTMEGMQN